MTDEKAYKTIANHIYIITSINRSEQLLIFASSQEEAREKANKHYKAYIIKRLKETDDIQIYNI